MDNMLKFDLPKDNLPIIKVIGVGGGGSNAVTHMFRQGIAGVDFFICNTDAQSLNSSPVPNKIILGATGLGAGSIPSVGKEAALRVCDEIKDILSTNTSMLFITAGMGGGTGTGAAPVIAQVAKELGILTVGIVTKPFGFEGRKRAQQAVSGIEELKKYVDATLVICNDKLLDMQGDLKLSQAFCKADDVLTIAAKGIAEIITVEGRVNVDFEDVNTVMKSSGKAIMGAGIASGPDRALKAVEMAMNSPLLDDTDVSGADNVLLYITSGKNEITLEELNEITGYITEKTGETANVIWGDGRDDKLEDEIAITLIATGFDKPIIKKHTLETPRNTFVEPEPQKECAGEIKIVEKPKVEEKSDAFTGNDIFQIKSPVSLFPDELSMSSKEVTPQMKEKLSFDEPKIVPSVTAKPQETSLFNDEIKIVAPQEQQRKPLDCELQYKEQQEQQRLDRVSKLKNMSYGYNNPNSIEELEKIPAYMRQNIDLSTKESSSNPVSRYTLNVNDNRVGLSENNPFLHDNVD